MSEHQEDLNQAQLLFDDSIFYEKEVLLAYYRLVLDLFGENAKNETSEFVLSRLKDACMMLKSRELSILTLRYGLLKNTPMTFAEIANNYKLTEAKTKSIYKKAIRKLKHPSKTRMYKISDTLAYRLSTFSRYSLPLYNENTKISRG